MTSPVLAIRSVATARGLLRVLAATPILALALDVELSSAQTPPILVSDTFTGSDGTALTAHAPDVNHAIGGWTLSGGSPMPTLQGAHAAVGAGGGHLQLTIDS